MTKDEFVQKYLSCESEAEKALLIWHKFKPWENQYYIEPEELDDVLKVRSPFPPYEQIGTCTIK